MNCVAVSFHCFEEDSLLEAAAAAALVVGEGEELRPGHACRRGQGTEYFQHVGEFAGEVASGGAACLLGLFGELGQQRLAVARLVEHAGYRAAAFGPDDLGDPVPYQLAVANRHASTLARRGIARVPVTTPAVVAAPVQAIPR